MFNFSDLFDMTKGYVDTIDMTSAYIEFLEFYRHEVVQVGITKYADKPVGRSKHCRHASDADLRRQLPSRAEPGNLAAF